MRNLLFALMVIVSIVIACLVIIVDVAMSTDTLFTWQVFVLFFLAYMLMLGFFLSDKEL